jgi:hypothetical protein
VLDDFGSHAGGPIPAQVLGGTADCLGLIAAELEVRGNLIRHPNQFFNNHAAALS